MAEFLVTNTALALQSAGVSELSVNFAVMGRLFGGDAGLTRRQRVLGHAAALLHPLGFDEPFGLSVVEAMACGTPVVGYRRGALPETVTDGVTGYLVDNVDGAVEAVPRAFELDRASVAETTRNRFSAERMVAGYLAVYERILQSDH